MGKLQHNKGITLIALIVTIVVLLILAGVSIAVITGDDGVIKSANQAKTEQRGGTVEDRVAVWKAGKATSKYTHRETKTEDEMLNDLISDKLVFEDEIDRENQKITIGSKEIDYSTGSGLKLESDKGKEELILEYEVSAGDTIKLPYYDSTSDGDATEFNFQVDWGDGTTETGITKSNISEKSKHQYQNAGTYDIKIKGKYESLQMQYKTDGTENYDKLKKVKQWGTTGLRYVGFKYGNNLNEIASPTESSFVNLVGIWFLYAKIQSIPENLFANCPNVTSFEVTFCGCSNLTSIPEKLFANCLNATSFEKTFYECTNLTGNAPELWKRGTNSEENYYMGNPNGWKCFTRCKGLKNYEEIPGYWTDELE